MHPIKNILITGSSGQIGRVLVPALKKIYGPDAVLAIDLKSSPSTDQIVDCSDSAEVQRLIEQTHPQHIYHLAAILSATGERQPLNTWDVNMMSWLNILEAAREAGTERLFFPSSIAVYGPDIAASPVADNAPTRPTTIYGITKACGENLSAYYHKRYQLDIRTLRYPGIIGWESEPGGGTTDYAIEIFRAAVKGETFRCPLSPDRRLPMLAMSDAVRGTIAFMQADSEQILHRSGYNIGGFSVTPAELTIAIRKHIPDFCIEYIDDPRDSIAASWPQNVDDSAAREHWNWQAEYDLATLSQAMIAHYEAEEAAFIATEASRTENKIAGQR